MVTTWITICDTCKRESLTDLGSDAQPIRTDGEKFAELIETKLNEAVQNDGGNVRSRRVSCLMGCKRACNVAIQAPGKLAYTLGEFEVLEEAAEGVVAYAIAHSESPSGQVPYRTWPEAIKGHFVTRHPPLPEDEQA